jgi:hypothetical protein
MMGMNKKFGVLFTAVLLILSGSLHAQQWTALGMQGRSVELVGVHPDAPDTIFAADGDSLFKSPNGGNTFSRVFGNPGVGRDLRAIALAPSDPKTVIITDEGLFANNGKFFQTTDGGRNWTQSPSGLPGEILDVALDPSDPSVGLFSVAGASTGGLYRLMAAIDTLICKSVVFDPSNSDIIYEGLTQGNGIGKSTDGGTTWSYFNQGFNGAANFEVRDIVVNPLNTQELFALGRWFANLVEQFEVYHSVDGGMTWAPMGFTDQALNRLAIDGSQGFLFIAHNQGLAIRSLRGGEFIDLTGDIAAPRMNDLAVVTGVKLIAGTNDGVHEMPYLPILNAAAKKVDEVSGNGNGIPEAGETVNLAISLVNTLFDGSDISATLSVINDPSVTVTDGAGDYPDIPANSSADNGADPFTVEIDAGAAVHAAMFEMTITANGGAYTATDTVTLMIGAPTVLVVDDDGGAAYDTFYTTTLDSMGVAFDVWNTNTSGQLTNQLQQPSFYRAVVWMSGDEETDILTEQDITILTDYVTNGGRLILTGQNILEDLDSRGDPMGFMADVLHVGLQDPGATGRLLFGVDGDVLGDQIEKALISGGNGANNQSSPDIIAVLPDSVAKPFVTYVTPLNAVAGVHWEDEATASAAIVLGFGFEAINRTNPDDTTMVSRIDLMSMMLDLLDPAVGIGDGGPGGEVGIPRAFALGQNFPNPFNPSTTIKFSVEGAGRVALKVYDLRGRLVRTLVDDRMEGGEHAVQWDGTADNGEAVGSGIYIYRITSGDHVAARKMVLLK